MLHSRDVHEHEIIINRAKFGMLNTDCQPTDVEIDI